MPHGRLQEWVAEEKGFFTAEGLDYTFLLKQRTTASTPSSGTRAARSGPVPFETFGAGRDGADVSCACHWATNAAAGERSGQLRDRRPTRWRRAPIVVPPESPVRGPADLAGVPVGVGYHSGSHFATVQALEGVLGPERGEAHVPGPAERAARRAAAAATSRPPPCAGCRSTSPRPSGSARSWTPRS